MLTKGFRIQKERPSDTEREILRALDSIAAGQDALPRQVRTFPETREALIQGLAKPGRDALAQWQARGSNDLGVMLLEMWAYVSDLLSFYDERIANESYIRTAQRAISLRRHVELLGYIPAPGVAGSVTLAAIAEGRKAVTLPAGTAFRSDAFDDQPPQVFEVTGETFIHPFKNEWTIGPVKQPTAGETAAGTSDAARGRRATGARFRLRALGRVGPGCPARPCRANVGLPAPGYSGLAGHSRAGSRAAGVVQA